MSVNHRTDCIRSGSMFLLRWRMKCLYDRAFIDQNKSRRYVWCFSINEGNIRIQDEIKEKEASLASLQTERNTILSQYEGIKAQPAVLRAALDKACWDELAEIRSTDFPEAMKKKRNNKSSFVDELLRAPNSVQHDMGEMHTLYEAAFSTDSTVYHKMPTVSVVYIEQIKGFELLGKATTSRADTIC